MVPKEKVVGQQVSSLHRLKDINDEGKLQDHRQITNLSEADRCVDGGFFVFGDISLRSLGTHRLKFDLYNLEAYVCQKTPLCAIPRSQHSADFLPTAAPQSSLSRSSPSHSKVCDMFLDLENSWLTGTVVSNKDFKGLSESSHLSRTFSDQGVRLRLRKEPRSLGG